MARRRDEGDDSRVSSKLRNPFNPNQGDEGRNEKITDKLKDDRFGPMIKRDEGDDSRIPGILKNP